MIPEINMDLFGFESYTLLIRRGRQGFGFTVLGSCPVQVGRIDKDSPAAAAGLLVEDCVVRINGQNVSRSAADSVARIVRESEKYIIVEIYRLPLNGLDSPPVELTSTPWLPHEGCYPLSNSNIHPPPFTSTSISSASVSRSNSLRARSPFSSITNFQSKCDTKSTKSDIMCNKRDLTPKKRGVISIKRDVMTKRDVTPVRDFRVNQTKSCLTNGRASEEELSRRSREVTPSPGVDSGFEKSGSTGGRGSAGSVSSGSERSSGYSGERNNTGQDQKPTGRARINIDDCLSVCSGQDLMTEGDLEKSRQEAVEALVSCEEEFLLDVQLGVKRYLRPLKNHGLLSPQDHAAVFHNIEAIAALSEYHVRQLQCRRIWRKSVDRETDSCELHDEDNDDHMTDAQNYKAKKAHGCYRKSGIVAEQPSSLLTVEALADVYIAKAEEFCDGYERYCGGVKEAFRILIALKRRPDVDEFLRAVSTDCGNLTLSTFLQSPLQHIRDTVLKMQRLLQCTPVESVDYKKLKAVIQGIRACCHRINESNTQRYGSSLTLASRADTSIIKRSKKSAMSLSSSSSSDSINASTFAGSIVSSIDTELLEIQGRLVFPSDIPSFQLATASHHLIYSGLLELIDTDSEDSPHTASNLHTPQSLSKMQLFVLLLSDLILLTRPDPDTDSLHVIEEPVILRDIVGSNFNCPHPCEFLLCVETPMTGLHEAWEPFPVLLRAPSVELKCTWKNILEQRIFTCKSAREQTIVNKNINNII